MWGFFTRVLSIGDDIPRNKCSENGFRSRFSKASKIFGHPRVTIYRWMKELHEEIKDELDKIKKK